MKPSGDSHEEPLVLTPEQLAMIDEAEKSLAEGLGVSEEEAFAQIRAKVKAWLPSDRRSA